MAAVMIGGMVPPCAIALATLLFKNKFTKEERESARSTLLWVWPSSQRERFHLRPLIPFMCFLPASSALESPAPCPWPSGCTAHGSHGGIFVFPVVGNAMMYLAALVIWNPDRSLPVRSAEEENGGKINRKHEENFLISLKVTENFSSCLIFCLIFFGTSRSSASACFVVNINNYFICQRKEGRGKCLRKSGRKRF